MTENPELNSEQIKADMQPVLEELKKRGLNYNSNQFLETVNATEEQMRGLGDVVEDVLTKFGITQERFKQWFNLKECNCTERKKWLNNLFSWKIKK